MPNILKKTGSILAAALKPVIDRVVAFGKSVAEREATQVTAFVTKITPELFSFAVQGVTLAAKNGLSGTAARDAVVTYMTKTAEPTLASQVKDFAGNELNAIVELALVASK